MTRQEFVNGLLDRASGSAQEKGEAFAPANIALCKYWGKRNEELNLPVNSSLSISLGTMGSTTSVTRAVGRDRVWLNGKPAPARMAARVSTFLDLFRGDDGFFEVRTRNTVPTGAGLASSASGFAALTKALDELMGWGLNPRELSMLARLGSGSASRSMYRGFAVWHAGVRADGMDSYAELLPGEWQALRIGILKVSAAAKAVGSTDGMNRTTMTSELYEAWPAQAQCDYDELRTAVAASDFTLLGETAENNAMAMHAVMLAAWPPLCYWTPRTLSCLQRVWKAREEGLEVYATIDAGPNIKLLFLAADTRRVQEVFPQVEIIVPFV